MQFNVEIAPIIICYFSPFVTNLNKHIIAGVGNLIKHIVDVLVR